MYIANVFLICSSSHVSLTTILGGGDWQSRWNYPHLIDVETGTRWGILAGGERPWVDHGFLAESGGTKLSSCSSRALTASSSITGAGGGLGCPSPHMRCRVNVHDGMWPGAFPPWTSPGGNPELDPGHVSLPPDRTEGNSDKPQRLRVCPLAATLYIPPVLCEGPFLLSRLVIGQHSFQCFVNLRDNTSTDLICIIWPLLFFVGFL